MHALDRAEEEEFFSWFPVISQEMIDYANNVALLNSRYLIARKVNRDMIAYCTHCHEEMAIKGLHSGTFSQCPNCGSTCYVRFERYGIRHLCDWAHILYWSKSPKDPRVVVAQAMNVQRDYRNGYRDITTEFSPSAAYVFEPAADLRSFGRARMVTREWWPNSGWQQRAKIFWNGSSTPNRNFRCDESFLSAIDGTPFARMGIDWRHVGTGMRAMELAATYPCIEYLAKTGFETLVHDALNDSYTRGAINWRARTPWGVLRVSKAHLHRLKGSAMQKKIDFDGLRTYQMGLKDGSKFSPEEAMKLGRDFGGPNFTPFVRMEKYSSLRRAARYVERQISLRTAASVSRWGVSIYEILGIWKDYLADCATLEMDFEDDRVVFPKDLYAAHAETGKRIKSQADALMDKAIRKRLPALQERYCYEADDLLIRPAKSTKEMIREGTALHICVGQSNQRYIKDYAAGKCIILFIRRASDPKKPFYCVELSLKGEVRQCHGLRHASPTPEVRAFLARYQAEVLHPQPVEHRIQVAI